MANDQRTRQSAEKRGVGSEGAAATTEVTLEPCMHEKRNVRALNRTPESGALRVRALAEEALMEAERDVLGENAFVPTGNFTLYYTVEARLSTANGRSFASVHLEMHLLDPAGHPIGTFDRTSWGRDITDNKTNGQAVFLRGDMYSLFHTALHDLEPAVLNEKPCIHQLERIQGATLTHPADFDQRAVANEDGGRGRQYALLVGISRYSDATLNLSTPHADVMALQSLLLSRYGFRQVQVLEDNEATREGILKAMERLDKVLEPSDSLLLFYAGHGWMAPEAPYEGYWLPYDSPSDKQSPQRWISNAEVRDTLARLHCRHVLLVSDSCYSGRLIVEADGSFQAGDATTATLVRSQRQRSREIITSGGLEPVKDGGGNGHSIFAQALLTVLEHPLASPLTTRHLFTELALRLRAARVSQRPSFRQLEALGHQEDGTFVLYPD